MRILSLGALLAVLGAAVWFATRPEPAEPPAPKKATFVRRAACMSCHQDYYDKWEGSHHDLAMDVATEQTVLGDFSQPPFSQRDGSN